MADILAMPALAEENEATVAVSSEGPSERHDKHNRQWRRAKMRARQAGRRANPGDVVREFRRELNSPDIVVTVCVINVINKAENVVALGGDANQVINIIDRTNCEIP